MDYPLLSISLHSSLYDLASFDDIYTCVQIADIAQKGRLIDIFVVRKYNTAQAQSFDALLCLCALLYSLTRGAVTRACVLVLHC